MQHMNVTKKNADAFSNTCNPLAQKATFLESPINRCRTSHLVPNGDSVVRRWHREVWSAILEDNMKIAEATAAVSFEIVTCHHKYF